MKPTQVRIVEWYRVDAGARIRRALLAGPLVLTLGGLIAAVSFLARQSLGVRMGAAAGGFVFVVGGAVFTVSSMYRILRDDAYLAIRTDGLALHDASRGAPDATVLSWDEIEAVRWDAVRARIIVERKGGAAVIVAKAFARIQGAALAQRIEHARRRAGLGLLH